ncbi:MAG: DUF402 domain-containing protein [Actinomycetia bacterium]|nr:DUF402 domain-containing protein [Actinomycetes bacterium]
MDIGIGDCARYGVVALGASIERRHVLAGSSAGPEETVHHIELVWHFWEGLDRDFVCWYLNLHTAFVRAANGYDTQDLELDIVVFPDGSHVVKDAEVLDDRVGEGRFSPELVDWIRSYGSGLVDRLESEGPWWDQTWANWTPQTGWVDPRLPADWHL